MKILCVLGEHNYGNVMRGMGYEYVHFLPALRRLGHEVSHFESFSREPYTDFADMNRQLLKRVQSEQPDIIFFVLLGYEVWLETLSLISKGTNAVLINWSTDDSWKYDQFSKFVAPSFDIYVTTYPKAVQQAVKHKNNNFHLSQWASNACTLQPPLPATQCSYKVSFIGTRYGNRAKWIARLAKEGIHVECFGYGWPNGPVASEKIPEIILQSVVSLNFGDSGLQWRGFLPTRSRQIKARLFEVPGAGGFLLTEAAEGLEQYFAQDIEVVSFNTIKDLVEKINFYLENDIQRDKVARAGFQKAVKHHTYEMRFSALLDKARKKRKKKSFSTIAMHEFEIIAKRHVVGWCLGGLRGFLLLPCLFFWGKSRGGRAARRILFELSWRLFGRKTYTAMGWPGRLFYKYS